jgi:hypothetical protein
MSHYDFVVTLLKARLKPPLCKMSMLLPFFFGNIFGEVRFSAIHYVSVILRIATSDVRIALIFKFVRVMRKKMYKKTLAFIP